MAGLFRVYARRPFLFTTPTPVSSSICHISDHWHSRLLRACCKRPSSHAAEEREELAPLHSLMPPVLPSERIAHLGTAVIAITPPKTFSKEVAQKIGHPISPPGPLTARNRF
jgi:hypothetical protein